MKQMIFIDTLKERLNDWGIETCCVREAEKFPNACPEIFGYVEASTYIKNKYEENLEEFYEVRGSFFADVIIYHIDKNCTQLEIESVTTKGEMPNLNKKVCFFIPENILVIESIDFTIRDITCKNVTFSEVVGEEEDTVKHALSIVFKVLDKNV